MKIKIEKDKENRYNYLECPFFNEIYVSNT